MKDEELNARPLRRGAFATLFWACATGATVVALVPAARKQVLAGCRDLVAIAGALGVPPAIDWDAKNAYRKCDYAVDGWLAWPSRAEDACAKMRMCLDEASLSAERNRRLETLMRSVLGCAAP